MIKIKTPIFILIALSFCPSYTFAQKENLSQKLNIQKAESLIDYGKSAQASMILTKIIKDSVNYSDVAKAKILSARILHENGQRVNAIELLQYLLALRDIQQPQNINLRVDAYLSLADCYFSMFWIEKYKKIADTLLQICQQNNLPEYYRARAYTNMVRYYNYHVFSDKSKPFIDSLKIMLVKSVSTANKQYRPVAIYTALINYYRNTDAVKLYQIVNSAVLFLDHGYPGERFNQAQLWRAIGNAYFDKAKGPDKIYNRKYNSQWYNKAVLGFSKAISVLQQYYSANQIDLVQLHNLLGLLDYSSGYFNLALKKFSKSELILHTNNYPQAEYAFSYLNTYLWGLKNIDSAYSGGSLYAVKQNQLTRLIILASEWEKWEQRNSSNELPYYRDIYSVTPYAIIVSLCYDLYQISHDIKFLDQAFAAQERSKNFFLKSKMIERYKLIESALPSIKQIQQELLPEETVISYSDATSYLNCSFAMVITKDKASIFKIDINTLLASPLKFKNTDSVCKNLDYFKQVNHMAYNVFFKPFRQMLGTGINRLLIMPSTFSSYINMEMMLSDTVNCPSFKSLPYLYKKYKVRYEFSYEVAKLRKQMASTEKKAAINLQTYIPDYSNTDFYTLPFFKQMGQVLETQFSFTGFTNKRATLSAFHSNAGNASVLHIAGHCNSNDIFTGDFSIALDNDNSGAPVYLKPQAIINTPLNTDLTVLALCETGLGESFVSDSYINMAYWFTYAGSKSCLYSCWKLDDRSTSYILERFYHYLAKGLTKSASLQNAKQDYLNQAKTEEEKNPVYWAGLTLIGDDSPVNITEKTGFNYWYLSFLLAIPVFIYFRRKRK